MLLLDRAKVLGRPVKDTGGVAKWWLEDLGIEPPQHVIAATLKGVELVSPGGKRFLLKLQEEVGYVLYRDQWAQYLFDWAVKLGAKGETQQRVTRSIFEATASKVKVLASGPARQMAEEMGLLQPVPKADLHVGIQHTVENNSGHDPEVVSLFFGSDVAPQGYAWVFPEGKDRLRVGVGVPSNIGEPGKFLEAFYNKYPEYRGKISDTIGGVIPTAKPLKKTFFPFAGGAPGGTFLIGDAGLHTVPSHGGGIYTAMKSGEIAGDVIGTVLSGPQLICSYEDVDKRRKGLYTFLKRHYIIKRFVYAMSDKDWDTGIENLKSFKLKSMNAMEEVPRLARYLVRKNWMLLPKFLKAYFSV